MWRGCFHRVLKWSQHLLRIAQGFRWLQYLWLREAMARPSHVECGGSIEYEGVDSD